MSDAETNTATAVDAHDEHGSGPGHEAEAGSLGPPDVKAWGAALLGAVIGLLVVLALFAATQA